MKSNSEAAASFGFLSHWTRSPVPIQWAGRLKRLAHEPPPSKPEAHPRCAFPPGRRRPPPPFLAGRAAEQQILADAAAELDGKDERGRANIPQNIILYGPRGNGKTTLTLWLQDFTADKPRVRMPVRINAGDCGGDPDALARLLAPEPWRKRVMERGWSASALGFGLSLPARPDDGWSVAQALASRPARAPSLVIIDEAHMLGAQASRLLLNASHELRGAGAPLLLVLAGTPELEDTLRSAKASHWERGHKIPLGRLDAESAPSALLEPLKKHGASMTEDALDIAMRETLGYPFFLQLFGRHLVEAMNEARSDQADKAVTERAAKAFHPDRATSTRAGAVNSGSLAAPCPLPLPGAPSGGSERGRPAIWCWPLWNRTVTTYMTSGTACSAAGCCGRRRKAWRRASPACWTARCGRPGHRQTPPTWQDLQSVVNGRSGVPPLLARNNGHWCRSEDLLTTNFAADAIKLPAIRAAASGSAAR